MSHRYTTIDPEAMSAIEEYEAQLEQSVDQELVDSEIHAVVTKQVAKTIQVTEPMVRATFAGATGFLADVIVYYTASGRLLVRFRKIRDPQDPLARTTTRWFVV